MTRIKDAHTKQQSSAPFAHPVDTKALAEMRQQLYEADALIAAKVKEVETVKADIAEFTERNEVLTEEVAKLQAELALTKAVTPKPIKPKKVTDDSNPS